MKKILIGLIVCMFIISMIPGIVGEKETDECTFKERKFIEDRKIIPVYTEHGLERAPGAKGKPGAYVTITNPGDGDTDLTVKIENIGDVPIYVVRVWFNDEYYEVNEIVTASSSEIIGPYNVTVQNATSVVSKIVTARGNSFYGSSGDLTWFIDGGWSTTSLGICVFIQNSIGGEYQITLHNITTPDWSDIIYTSKAKEWKDVVASTPVDDPSIYEIIVKKKQGN